MMFNGECLEFKQIRFGILSAERHPLIDEQQGCLLALFGVQHKRYPDRGITSITGGKRVARCLLAIFSLVSHLALLAL